MNSLLLGAGWRLDCNLMFTWLNMIPYIINASLHSGEELHFSLR